MENVYRVEKDDNDNRKSDENMHSDIWGFSSYNEWSEEILKRRIDENSLSRIWQFVEENNRSFGVIAAYRGGNLFRLPVI